MTIVQIVLLIALALVGLGMVFAVYMLIRLYLEWNHQRQVNEHLERRLAELEVSDKTTVR